MLIHKELEIKSTKDGAQNIFEALALACKKNEAWRVDNEWMGYTVSNDDNYRSGEFGIYVKRIDGVDRFGVILLFDSEKRSVYIANIIPIINRELKTIEYNGCFDEFWNEIGKTALRNFRSDIRGGNVSCKDILTPLQLDIFNKFKTSANKRVLHPFDERRWRQFVIQMAFARCRLTGRQIQSLLIEFEWDKDTANEMAKRYEYEVAILRQYKGSRG